MTNTFKYWWLILIRGIILIALALYIFSNPVAALVGLAFYIGIGLLFTGVFEIIAAMSLRGINSNWGWNLAGGIFDVLFAMVLLSNPGVTAAVIPFIVGFWIMISGVLVFINSFNKKAAGIPAWWLGLISGILTIIVGYFITANILVGAFTVTIWIGIGFLIAGFVNVMLSFRMKKGNELVG